MQSGSSRRTIIPSAIIRAWKTEYRSQCPSLPYPITLFNADSASAECSATTIGPQPDECRFFFWTIRVVRQRDNCIWNVIERSIGMQSKVTEIAPGTYRISTFHPDYKIQFNQFLIEDDEPFLMHTGFKRMFQSTLEGVASIMDPAKLRWIGFSHFESDECGALNEWL